MSEEDRPCRMAVEDALNQPQNGFDELPRSIWSNSLNADERPTTPEDAFVLGMVVAASLAIAHPELVLERALRDIFQY